MTYTQALKDTLVYRMRDNVILNTSTVTECYNKGDLISKETLDRLMNSGFYELDVVVVKIQ